MLRPPELFSQPIHVIPCARKAFRGIEKMIALLKGFPKMIELSFCDLQFFLETVDLGEAHGECVGDVGPLEMKI